MNILKTILRIVNYLERKEFEKLLKNPEIKIGNDVTFKRFPLIQLHPTAKLIIGNNVTINSDNYGYHVNLYSPCKFMADRPEAIIIIGDNTRIHGSCIHAYNHIEIGKNCLIAANCQIMDGNGHHSSFENVDNRINTTGSVKKIVIEDSVWLSTGVVVLPGVRIGKGSIIGANSVVENDIPEMSVAKGVPAVVIKKMST
jgi:acetyltransferase-like isoleucine patch superfamily enzyme